MSELSWLIYLSDVLSNLKGSFIFISIALGFLYAAQWFLKAVTEGSWEHRYSKTLIIGCLFFGAASAIFPSRTTVLMIAAAEAGNKVVQTEAARGIFEDAVNLLRKKLREAEAEEGGAKKGDRT